MSFIYTLCSSSKGNCTYIGTKKSGVLIDAGIGIKKFATHLSMIDVKKSAIKAIFVTHEHTDHISGLARIQKALNIPLYASKGTLKQLVLKGTVSESDNLNEINESVLIDDIKISPFKTPHDCVESVGYVINTPDNKKISICTDLGYVTDGIHNSICGSDFVLIESNYDKGLLEVSDYPYMLKKRIAGEKGHLSNEDCTAEILKLFSEGTKNFLLGHLSEQNNRPELAYAHVVSALAKQGAKVAVDYNLKVAPKTNVGNIIEVK